MRKAFFGLLVGIIVAATAGAGEMDILLRKLIEKGILTQQDATEIVAEIESEAAGSAGAAPGSASVARAQHEARSRILPNGDSQLSRLDDINLTIGLQYRAMWNASNIPLGGVTTADDTRSYDFFRQRMRLNIDVQPTPDVGGFLQLEYRGGWGGSSPTASDPRGAGLSGVSAFNRLQARGLRYGYVYFRPTDESYVAAGIIPVSDQLGDTLFSADWDFNVGGITYQRRLNGLDDGLRLAAVRLVDGVASSDSAVVDENGDLLIADLNLAVGDAGELGAHIYYLNIPDDIATAAGLPGEVSQGWYAISGTADLGAVALNGFVSLNSGEYGAADNTGWALKGEAAVPVGAAKLKVLGIYTTGDETGTQDNQYRTIQGIVGTSGYWAYTHLFTANGPSDVNDLGIGLDLGGRGLTTIQAKVEAPIADELDGEIFGGWFRASEGSAPELGTEIGAMLTYHVKESLSLQLGLAYAFLGDYYDSAVGDADDLFEVFSRFQLQF